MIIVNGSNVEIEITNAATVEVESKVDVIITGGKGDQGIQGVQGEEGLSAYEVAVENGFEGTEEEWLESLQGPQGPEGLSAYEVAVENGFEGTEEEWLESLQGPIGPEGISAYEVAVENGFEGTEAQWLISLIGPSGPQGPVGVDGKTVRSGIGPPTTGLGADGDFYINISIMRIYGPKTSGVWNSGVSLLGPPGPQGPVGMPTDEDIIAASLLFG